MPLTPNYNIYYRDTSTPASLETESALQADSVDDALVVGFGTRQIQTYRWANAAARTAQAGMQSGDTGYQIDTGVSYRYTGTAWREWESDWIDYSGAVTVTGWASGTGVGAAKAFSYRWMEGRIRVKWYLGFGTTGASVSALVTFTLPMAAAVPPHSDYGYVGGGEIWDATPSVKRVNCGVISNGSSATVVKIYTTTLTGNGYDFVTAGVPITWAVGDAVHGEFEYDPA